MSLTTYFLSSLDSKRFMPVRQCTVHQVVLLAGNKPSLVATLDPPVIGQDFGRGNDIRTVLLTARHAGKPVDPINEFPCFVHIAIPREEWPTEDSISAEDFQSIGWGELYRTAEDAQDHRFD